MLCFISLEPAIAAFAVQAAAPRKPILSPVHGGCRCTTQEQSESICAREWDQSLGWHKAEPAPAQVNGATRTARKASFGQDPNPCAAAHTISHQRGLKKPPALMTFE